MASKTFNHYVLGFAFDDIGRVALIRKNKPDWQRGRWNGIGGKVENENTADAMEREFWEETGVIIPAKYWVYVGEMRGLKPESWLVEVFTYTGSAVQNVRTTESEFVMLWSLRGLEKITCIENVPALIALCQIPVAEPSGVRPSFVLRY